MTAIKQRPLAQGLRIGKIALALLPTLFLTACGCFPRCYNANPKPQKLAPGLYRLNGWNGTRSDIDVEGEVGHQLYVSAPTADCEPSNNWSSNTSVSSGSLPPGLSMDEHGLISGIPTDRGHWIVEMQDSDVECGGQSFEGYTQQLRFHITGSGKVVE
jgi:hypothetical protein